MKCCAFSLFGVSQCQGFLLEDTIVVADRILKFIFSSILCAGLKCLLCAKLFFRMSVCEVMILSHVGQCFLFLISFFNDFNGADMVSKHVMTATL